MKKRISRQFFSADEYEATRTRLGDNRENIVSHSLELQARFNTTCAVEYLKSYQVDAYMIEDILLAARGAAPRHVVGG